MSSSPEHVNRLVTDSVCDDLLAPSADAEPARRTARSARGVFISACTVQGYPGRVFPKVGLSSRREVGDSGRQR